MYTEAERQIFPFRRAGLDAHADPMVVWRNLYAALDGQDMASLLANVAEPDPRLRLGALGRLAELARAAFGFEPISPDGVSGDTENHAVQTLYAFFAWENSLKNSPGSTPSGSPPSACSPDRSTT